MNAYFVLWPADWCKRLHQADEKGPLQVIYGGPHTSVPPLGKVTVGDLIYPVSVKNGQLFILSRMQVEQISRAETYLQAQGISRPEGELWDTASPKLLKQQAKLGHRIPRSCVDDAATGQGIGFRFDFAIPPEMANELRFGPKAGQEKGLLKDKSGNLSHISLQGSFRQLSTESAARIAELMREF